MIHFITRTASTLAAVLLLGAGHAAVPATPGGTRTALERALDRQLNRYLTYPVMATEDMTGEVTVSFAVSTDGRIEVIEATGTNQALRAYVLRRLAKVDIGSNPEGVWRTTHIRFVFRPQA